VNTFRERYCLARGCRPDRFVAQLFWRALHPHARLLVPVISFLEPEYFAPDRELLGRVGQTRTLRELNEELRDFTLDSRNRGWWRGRAHVRISTQRLRALARAHLTTIASGPANGLAA